MYVYCLPPVVMADPAWAKARTVRLRRVNPVLWVRGLKVPARKELDRTLIMMVRVTKI